MYAVIETGGKQYKVSAEDEIFVEKLGLEADETVIFDKVLALSDDKTVKLGTPYIEGAKVEGKVIKNGKAKKVTVMTYKPKKNEKRKMGHRQPYTKVLITDLGVGAKKAAKKSAKAAEPEAVAEEKAE